MIKFTEREAEVLQLLTGGCSSKEIASKMYITKRGVDFHITNIYRKLNVHNRVQAYAAASKLGLIEVRK